MGPLAGHNVKKKLITILIYWETLAVWGGEGSQVKWRVDLPALTCGMVPDATAPYGTNCGTKSVANKGPPADKQAGCALSRVLFVGHEAKPRSAETVKSHEWGEKTMY